MKRLALLVFFAAFALVLPVSAQASTLTGTISGANGFVDNYNFDCQPFNDGKVYYYEVYSITVSAAGVYQYTDNGPTGISVAFYQMPGFNPAAPTANCIDSFFGANSVNFPTAGVYMVVVSTVVDGVTGNFSFTLDGPGAVAYVTPSGCSNPLPPGSAVYSVPAGAPAFYAADLGAQTTFNLPAGTWWISQFSGDFARVWIACQASSVWIPANAVAR